MGSKIKLRRCGHAEVCSAEIGGESMTTAPTLRPQAMARSDSELFEQRIKAYAATRDRTIRILEAGCGRRWSLDLTGVRFSLTGVNINSDCMKARHDLDCQIVGDLRSVELDPDAYDVAFCSFVLEHVEGAEQVLTRLIAALKPGGVLLLRIPDRDSAYGFMARHSPHRLHVLFKRYIQGNKNAGKPGYGPFPVAYDPVVSWHGIVNFCNVYGLEITDALSSDFYLRSLGAYSMPARFALRLVAILSIGRLTDTYINIAVVVRKPLRSEVLQPAQ